MNPDAPTNGGPAAPRFRFAPSPTGPVHVGNARTALFNWLAARHLGGAFIYRVEDTDRERSRREFEAAQMDDLRWLGLDWDEGPDIGGPNGPYRQSERDAFYAAGLARLRENGLVYPCYCTDDELKERRDAALRKGLPPHYDGRCRNLSSDDRRRLEAEGRRPAHRFTVPQEEVSIRDIVRGVVTFGSEMVGDFVVMRSEGLPTYNFACVIDDQGMGITHVVRGEEHLSNTLRQELLYRALGSTPPRYVHLPLVLGPDREKLSKRHGDVSLRHYREEGFLPSALRNALALLGWSPGDNREIFTTEELVRDFDLARVGRSPSIFDQDKLNWIGQKHFQAAPLDVVTAKAREALRRAGFAGDLVDGDRLAHIVDVVREGTHAANDFPEVIGFLVKEPIVPDDDAKAAALEPKARQLFAALQEDLSRGETASGLDSGSLVASKWLGAVGKGVGLRGKPVFHPVRAALTGRLSGPELGPVVRWLGSDGVLRRIRAARDWS